MPPLRLASIDDPRLEAFRNLKATNATRGHEILVAEGDKLVHRMIDAGVHVESLLTTDRYLAEFAPRVAPETPIYVVDTPLIDQIVGFNFHRGVLACGRRPENLRLEALCSNRKRLTLVVCPEVHDPENLGAILRIAAVFGVQGVALGPDCCDPFSRRVLRVSMGAAFRMPICREKHLLEELARCQARGLIEAWATVTDREAPSFDGDPRPERLALVLGSEGHGLSDSWVSICHRSVTIPMRTDFDSLNVAVATGVLLYHLAH